MAEPSPSAHEEAGHGQRASLCVSPCSLPKLRIALASLSFEPGQFCLVRNLARWVGSQKSKIAHAAALRPTSALRRDRRSTG